MLRIVVDDNRSNYVFVNLKSLIFIIIVSPLPPSPPLFPFLGLEVESCLSSVTVKNEGLELDSLLRQGMNVTLKPFKNRRDSGV